MPDCALGDFFNFGLSKVILRDSLFVSGIFLVTSCLTWTNGERCRLDAQTPIIWAPEQKAARLDMANQEAKLPGAFERCGQFGPMSQYLKQQRFWSRQVPQIVDRLECMLFHQPLGL